MQTKSLGSRCLSQPLIGSDEDPPARKLLCQHEGRRKLKSVGGSKRMGAQEPVGSIADQGQGVDLRPRCLERAKPIERLVERLESESALAKSPAECRDDLGPGKGPYSNSGVLPQKLAAGTAGSLLDYQRYET